MLCMYCFYKNSIRTGKLKNFLHSAIPSIIIYLQKILNNTNDGKNHRANYQSHNSYYRQNQMSVDEAMQILGVNNRSSRDDITKAFKKLMLINHPDKGGTQYIAAKIIQAKKTLLGE